MTQSSPYSLPAAAPHYAPPPYAYRDCPVRIVPFRTAPGVTRRLTPEPLEPAAGDVMFIAVGRMNNDTLGSTQEAFCVVPARFGSQLGNFCVLLYLESDACITSGREIWGWPKKQARFEHVAGEPALTLVERGEQIIRIGLGDLESASAEDLGLEPTWFNFKLIPSVVAGAPPEVMQLTATTFRHVVAREVRRGEPTLVLGSGPEDPLAELMPVQEAIGGFSVRLDFELHHGVVLHDYLREGADVRAEPAPTLSGAVR